MLVLPFYSPQARFTEERVRLNEQLDQVREEYSCLKDVQATEITDYREKLNEAERVGLSPTFSPSSSSSSFVTFLLTNTSLPALVSSSSSSSSNTGPKRG